jgi:hypothetical protein
MLLLTKNYSGSHIREVEMGIACGIYGGDEKCIHISGGEA